jgi:hypothetical protein
MSITVKQKRQTSAHRVIPLSCNADRLFIQKRTDEQLRGVAVGIADQVSATIGDAVLHQNLPQQRRQGCRTHQRAHAGRKRQGFVHIFRFIAGQRCRQAEGSQFRFGLGESGDEFGSRRRMLDAHADRVPPVSESRCAFSIHPEADDFLQQSFAAVGIVAEDERLAILPDHGHDRPAMDEQDELMTLAVSACGSVFQANCGRFRDCARWRKTANRRNSLAFVPVPVCARLPGREIVALFLQVVGL